MVTFGCLDTTFIIPNTKENKQFMIKHLMFNGFIYCCRIIHVFMSSCNFICVIWHLTIFMWLMDCSLVYRVKWIDFYLKLKYVSILNILLKSIMFLTFILCIYSKFCIIFYSIWMDSIQDNFSYLNSIQGIKYLMWYK